MDQSALSVLIFGSCVSRDAIEIGKQQGQIRLVGTYERCSFASVSATPSVDEAVLAKLDSPFQRRMVRADMDKSVLHALGQSPFDCLLIDLIEERLHLLVPPTGGRVTLSNEYMAGAGWPVAGRAIRSGSPEYLHWWREGLMQFLEVLEASHRLDKIRVAELYWAQHNESGNPIPGIPQHHTLKVNAFLAELYAILRAALPATCFLQYPARYLVAADECKWGVAPFHYSAPLYDYTVTQLLASFGKLPAKSGVVEAML
ncbi:MAG: DUF6270 domain-containing protein [Pseudomonadota bacterium]